MQHDCRTIRLGLYLWLGYIYGNRAVKLLRKVFLFCAIFADRILISYFNRAL